MLLQGENRIVVIALNRIAHFNFVHCEINERRKDLREDDHVCQSMTNLHAQVLSSIVKSRWNG